YHGILPSTYSSWNRDSVEVVGQVGTSYELVTQYWYDDESNLKQAQNRPSATNEAMIAYLWSYNGAYVVAQVTNITSAELEDLLSLSREAFSDLTDTNTIRTELNNVRSSLTSADQRMTIYLFEDRFGISEMQDANGQTIQYIYDEFGRLTKTVDQKGNLVNAYRYNYLNPSQSFPQN
ncbi:MAG: RHS repeat domain-containing protein, partial [Bacteroidota bacterium]